MIWEKAFISTDAPSKIISLVPSQTELLHYLGLEEEVVGITKFCVHPAQWRKTKNIVGGTKVINHEKIKALKPDLVIANKEENSREDIERISGYTNVYLSDIPNLPAAMDMIANIGKICFKEAEANQLIDEINQNFRKHAIGATQKKAVYLIWKDPYMAAGGDCFINDLMARAGFINAFSEYPRYPQVEVEDIIQSGCTEVLISSEPFPFIHKHVAELGKLLPGINIRVVDGEMFSWYGSRLLHFPAYALSLQAGI